METGRKMDKTELHSERGGKKQMWMNGWMGDVDMEVE